MLWMNLPSDHPSEIKTKIFQEIKEELKTEQGVTKLLEVMAKAFKPAEQNQVMKIFLDFFVNMKKNPKETMMQFVMRFDKTAIEAKNKGMELSKTTLGLKIIHDAKLSDSQRHLVLVEFDFKNEDQVYEKAKMGLNKYLTDMDGKMDSESRKEINVKDKFFTKEEEALLATRGYFRGEGSSGRGHPSPFKPKHTSTPIKGAAGRGGGHGGRWGGGARGWSAGRDIFGEKEKEDERKRPTNARGANGERLLCLACGSFQHMIVDCEHSYERMKNRTLSAEEVWGEVGEESLFTESFFTENKVTIKEQGTKEEKDDVILYTGNNQERIGSLGRETLGRMLPDTGCTRNVCG